ncbi:MAG: hypothetical protein JTT11_09610, partial [Candidatus Brockarchaeota archaeon]|nr:hypothetical protein [Candidatus Brockarchaeota archaeon]
LQGACVRWVVDIVTYLDNVLYEIVNESGSYSTEWQYHMIRFVHKYEGTKPKQHPVGMTFQWSAKYRGTNENLFNSPADWISPSPDGGYQDNPPAADGSKVILSDTDHLWGIGGNQAWVWKSFCRGMNPLFMDPYHEVRDEAMGKKEVEWTDHLSGKTALDSRWDPIRRNLGYALSYAKRMDLASMVPSNNLASTGYCLSNLGSEYLVYLPDGGDVVVDLAGAPKGLGVEWFDPNTCEKVTGRSEDGGSAKAFSSPFGGDAVLYISRNSPKLVRN